MKEIADNIHKLYIGPLRNDEGVSYCYQGEHISGEELFLVIRALMSGEPVSWLALSYKTGLSYRALQSIVSLLEHLHLPVNIGIENACFQRPFDLLSSSDISSAYLPPSSIVFHSLGLSTNQLAKTLPFFGEERLCVFDYQSSGYGRQGRTWEAPLGTGITASYLYYPAQILRDDVALPLVVSFAVLSVLRALGFSSVALKWPNDLYIASHKVGGVLVEKQQRQRSFVRYIIGIGLNIHGHELIRQAGGRISLCEGGRPVCSRSTIIRQLSQYIYSYLEFFEKNSFSVFYDDWNKTHFVGVGHPCTVETIYGRKIEGSFSGVNHVGDLLLFSNQEERVIRPSDALYCRFHLF